MRDGGGLTRVAVDWWCWEITGGLAGWTSWRVGGLKKLSFGGWVI